jgi:hypothetical protein
VRQVLILLRRHYGKLAAALLLAVALAALFVQVLSAGCPPAHCAQSLQEKHHAFTSSSLCYRRP